MNVPLGTEAIALWKPNLERLLLVRRDYAQPTDPGAVMLKVQFPPPSGLDVGRAWYFTGWYCAQCRTTFFASSVADLHHEPCLSG